MIRWIVLLAGVLLLLRWWRNLYQRHGRHILPATFFALTLVVVALLAITGKMHWIGTVFVTLAWVLHRLIRMLPHLPLMARIWDRFRGNKGGAGAAAPDAKMTTKQALKVLGLKAGASKKEVIAAHRKLIHKLHPDRGGNDQLTRTVNRARDVLLKDLK